MFANGTQKREWIGYMLYQINRRDKGKIAQDRRRIFDSTLMCLNTGIAGYSDRTRGDVQAERNDAELTSGGQKK
jgi:hypothetical protein